MYFHDTFLVSAVAARCAAVAAGQFPVVLWHVLSQSLVGSNSPWAAAPLSKLPVLLQPWGLRAAGFPAPSLSQQGLWGG